MFKMFEPKLPNNVFNQLQYPAEIILLMQSGEILMTAESMGGKDKNHLDGKVFEIMVKMKDRDPYFVYYNCDEYYMQLMYGTGGINQAMGANAWRTEMSKIAMKFLADYILYTTREKIASSMVSYHHNTKHTNVIAYVESLGEWYPIKHGETEPDDISERRVHEINNGSAHVSQFVAIQEQS